MSVATEIKRLQDAKAAIKESITNKNVEVPDDVHVDKYNEYVDQIKTGEEFILDNLYRSAYLDKTYIWSDGENTYYSYGSGASTHYILDKDVDVWRTTTECKPHYEGSHIWTDGENVYLSYTGSHYILDKEAKTWKNKTWTFSGFQTLSGENVWRDGDTVYCSSGTSTQGVLNKETNTWSKMTWSGLTNVYKKYIWTDGENIYHSDGNYKHYVLDRTTNTWVSKTWAGFSSFNGEYIWYDGDTVYCSKIGTYYVLNKETSTWSKISGGSYFPYNGADVWYDGKYIRGSNGLNYRVRKPVGSGEFSQVYYYIPTSAIIYIDGKKYTSSKIDYLLFKPKE